MFRQGLFGAARGALLLAAHAVSRLPKGDRAWLARRALADRRSEPTRALAALAEELSLTWKNRSYDIAHNGEHWLLRQVSPFGLRTLFDIGANAGDWTRAAIAEMPQAEVHAFEINPTTAERAAADFARLGAQVRLNAFGLGEAESEVELFQAPGRSTLTTTVPGVIADALGRGALAGYETIRVRLTTGDAYLRSAGLAGADLVKIDVEGAEFAVLRGFEDAFARRAVTLLQFEYGQGNIASRALLADVVPWLEARGFVTGKLWQDRVAFKPYAFADEDFIGPNYVACLAERADLVAALGGR